MFNNKYIKLLLNMLNYRRDQIRLYTFARNGAKLFMEIPIR